MFAVHISSVVLFLAGRFRESEGPTEMALDLTVKLGARRYEAYTRFQLGWLRLGQDRIPEARQHLDTAMAIAQATGVGFYGPIICGVQAQACGAGADGRAWIDRGEEMLEQTGLLHNHVIFRKFAIDWAINAGDWPFVERMRLALIAYTKDEPIPYVDFFVSRAGALAALARNPDDLQAAATLERLAATATRRRSQALTVGLVSK